MPELGDYNPLDGLLEADESSTPAEPVQPEEGQGQPIADEPSAVQPQEGQGQQDAQTGLYDLSTVPEEYRSHVEQHLKDIERNANAKFQEHAEFRKSWEPYAELGLNDVDPEGVAALMEFAQALSDPESARDAITNLAQALELDLGAAPEAEESGEPDVIEQLRAEIAELKQAYTGDKEQQEIAALRQQADQAYRAEFAEVEQLNGKPFSREKGPNGEPSEADQLIDLARRFQMDTDEPIKAAYKFINSISGKAEKALVDSQPTPPAPAEPSGRASSSVQPVDTFEDALRLHLERNASAS
jgi:hypothetical protein